MTEDNTNGGETHQTRRAVLAGLGAAGAVGLAGCGGGGDGTRTTDTSTDRHLVGVSVPRTGVYSDEGDKLLAGYELAIEDINSGGGLVGRGAFDALDGGGVLGTELDLVSADTESTGSGATESARTLLDQGATMLTGGASAREAQAQQQVAADRDAVYMAGYAPSNAISGTNCSGYGFNEVPNAQQVASALAPTVTAELGTDRNYVQVYPRSPVGEELFASLETPLAEAGNWDLLSSVRTRVNASDYTSPIASALSRGPDVIVLNYYGIDGATVLDIVADRAPDVDVVTPLLDRTMAENAGDALAGTYGTLHWDPAVDGGSGAFLESWSRAYGDDPQMPDTPPGLAHLAYVQVLQWAAAAARGGSVAADAVVGELEGVQYDVGLGRETMRACDHRSERPVPVVRGLSADQQSGGDYFDLVTSADGVTYACGEGPAGDCSL